MNSKADATRRGFLKASTLVLSYSVAGVSVMLTPAEAYSAQADYQILSNDDAQVLEAIAEKLCPGAKLAGIAHFIDSQLAAPSQDCLLMLRYLGVDAPYRNFYLPTLGSIKNLLSLDEKKHISTVDAASLDELIEGMSSGEIEGWAGPPAAFFYFVLRSDSVDVTYGTEGGFAKLGIPYMAHINPPKPW